MPQSLVEGELLIRQQFFKELEIKDQEMEQHQSLQPAIIISHIYRQFAESNWAFLLRACCQESWLYHDIGKSL